jgi:hypothetical protein
MCLLPRSRGSPSRKSFTLQKTLCCRLSRRKDTPSIGWLRTGITRECYWASVEGRHFGSVSLLLASGACPNVKDLYGCTALHCSHSGIYTCRLLLYHGAHLGARDDMGRTPLDCARSPTVKYLLQRRMRGLASGSELVDGALLNGAARE